MKTGEDLLRAAQPETAAALDRMKAVAHETPDPALIELVRQRVSELLEGGDPIPQALSDAERAFVAFTDQFVFSVASVTQRDVDALLEHAEPVDVYRFVAALYTLEMSRRIEITTRAVLGREEVPA